MGIALLISLNNVLYAKTQQETSDVNWLILKNFYNSIKKYDLFFVVIV